VPGGYLSQVTTTPCEPSALLEPDGSCLIPEIDMAESDRARLLASYDDQLAELRRYL
jgi:hypothetical protein